MLVAAGPASDAAADPPRIDPDHGTPGTLILVDGFPSATDCPTVRMYLAPETGIASLRDPRLMRLDGAVGYATEGFPPANVRVPLYSFLVPNRPAGSYVTYFSCPGSAHWVGPVEVGRLRIEAQPPGRTPELLVLATPPRPADCPPLPVDAATLIRLRDTTAFACYGRTTLSFDGFVPRTTGLGGVSAPVWPRWLDPWAGGLLQATGDISSPNSGYGSGPFLSVAVPPALGICSSLYEEDPACPLAPHLNGWVRVSGHYDDPAALTCRIAGTSYRNPPSRSDTVAACRARFVLSAIGPATGLPPSATLPPTSTAAPVPEGRLDIVGLLALALGTAALAGIWHRSGARAAEPERSRGRS
jgi:hypothetical protein